MHQLLILCSGNEITACHYFQFQRLRPLIQKVYISCLQALGEKTSPDAAYPLGIGVLYAFRRFFNYFVGQLEPFRSKIGEEILFAEVPQLA